MSLIDESIDVRQGAELDIAKLKVFLHDSIPGLQAEITVRQFPGGFSNLTYHIIAGDKELILRKPPVGKKAKTAHDMSREYTMLKALKPVFPYCPTPLVYSDDLSIMGSPFYVMERINGIILRRDIPKELNLSPDDMRILCKKLFMILYKLHSLDYKQIGLENFGKPDGYIERQVKGWSERYRDARTPDSPDFENVMTWLKEKMPEKIIKASVIHNDYKFDNVVLDKSNPLNIIGVLDWEMATIGDPLMDLGNSLAYWVEKSDADEVIAVRQLPTIIDGALTRQEIVELYAEFSGLSIENFDFYLCFGWFRLAVISQQIYYRYFHGQINDHRFKMLINIVKVLDKVTSNFIERSKL